MANTTLANKPAFPVTKIDGDGISQSIHSGMTLREYYIAHAPTGYWSFFNPVMPEKPQPPKLPDDPVWNFTRTEIQEAKSWRDDPCFDLTVQDSIHGRPNSGRGNFKPFQNAWNKFWKEREEYAAEYKRQEQIQWPMFWADTMIDQLAKAAQ